jgi:hypothetical protein
MAHGAIFQYASRVHISVKIRRQNHSGAHFGPLRAIEAGNLLSACTRSQYACHPAAIAMLRAIPFSVLFGNNYR